MSVSRSSHYTPRSAASHGRIVTQNSSLSVALLREKSSGIVADSPSALVDSTPALDVVSSNVNEPNVVSNPADNTDVQYVVVSKSRLSLNHASNSESQLSAADPDHRAPAQSTDRNSETYRADQTQHNAPSVIKASQVKDSIEHHKYSYHSLKKSGRTSSNSTSDNLLGNKTASKSSLKGGSVVNNNDFGDQSERNVFALTSVPNNKSAVGHGESVDTCANNNAHLNSRPASNSQGLEHTAPGSKDTSARRHQPSAHDARSDHQHSLDAHQHTRLSLNTPHDRITRDREPFHVDPIAKSVPPLDLTVLSQDKAPSDFTDSDSDIPVSSQPRLQAQYSDQKLHASDPNSSVLHSSAYEYNQTGRKTYEVATPLNVSQLPHVKSSDNFSGEPDTYRDQRQADPQPLENQRDEQTRSDLADDLELPSQFDTQANREDADTPRPPSLPVQTTPPPQAEPATSLHSKSNSTVYAVANPEVLRAQGISPPPSGPYIHSHSRRSDHAEVRFDPASRQSRPEIDSRSPIKDRPPTPYTRTPQAEEPRESSGRQRRGSAKTLPPQHPPLDTQQKPGSTSRSRRESATTLKRIYVESPSFTKEEEDEYRFVNSRLDDLEDKDKTYRDMATKERGYGGDDMNYSQGYQQGDNRSQYSRKKEPAVDSRSRQEPDRNQDRGRDQYDRRSRDRYDANENRDRYEDRNHDKYDDRNRDKYEDRNRDNYDNRNREKFDDRKRDRYEDRNTEMNGYADNRSKYGQSEEGRYEDREKYSRDDPAYDPRERYDNLQNERDGYEREVNRDPEPNFKRYQKQNTEVLDEQDLRKESEYQLDLKKRMDREKEHDRDRENYIGEELRHRDSYDRENFARDSLDYPEDGDTGRVDQRDLEYGYAQQNGGWDNPPQNPYQENGYSQYPQQDFEKQSSKPDFYDPEDAMRMEIVNPKQPKYDYVEHNKEDYGMLPRKTYRDLVHKKREEEERLEHVFVTPKVPPKQGKRPKGKKAMSAQPEHMGYQPPVQDQYPLGFKPSSAEELWAKKAANLTVKKDSAGGSKPKGGSAGKPPKWNINSKVNHAYSYKAPAPMPNQGSAYKPVGQPASREQGYTTPTRALQPLDNKPAPPTSTEMVPTAIQPQSPFRRHGGLQPITREIKTEDGQTIQVDINLRLMESPRPQGSGQVSPTGQQMALVPVQETQGQYVDPDSNRGIGVPYQMQDTYGGYNDMGYSNMYQELRRMEIKEKVDQEINDKLEKKKVKFGQDLTHTVAISDVEQQISAEELALTDPTGYSKRHQVGGGSPGSRDDAATSESIQDMIERLYRDGEQQKEDGSYAALYQRTKNKDPEADPWYKVYNLNDYKKMQREVRLNRGTLGPDLDTMPYRERLEKRHRQFEYARGVMEKNRVELGHKKPPTFPRQPPKQGEENIKRRAALEYSKNVPKPTVKTRPNQYNSYEVSAQLAQGGGSLKSPSSTSKATPPPTRTVDVIDIKTLEQRHLAERKTTDQIRQNMDSVLSQKAH